MFYIYIIILILFFVLVKWLWHSLGSMELSEKLKYMVLGIGFSFLLTFVIYNLSKIGITYENQEGMVIVRRVFVFIFTNINGYILLPYLFRKIEQRKNDEIDNGKMKKVLFTVGIIIMLMILIEMKYFAKIQYGILKM